MTPIAAQNRTSGFGVWDMGTFAFWPGERRSMRVIAGAVNLDHIVPIAHKLNS